MGRPLRPSFIASNPPTVLGAEGHAFCSPTAGPWRVGGGMRPLLLLPPQIGQTPHPGLHAPQPLMRQPFPLSFFRACSAHAFLP